MRVTLRSRAWLLRESREGRLTEEEMQLRQRGRKDGAAAAVAEAQPVVGVTNYTSDEVIRVEARDVRVA